MTRCRRAFASSFRLSRSSRHQYERLFENVILSRREQEPAPEWGPSNPGGYPPEDEAAYIFSDRDGNGLDDGRETQANLFRALFETLDAHPGVVHGAFFWDNWIASDEHWQEWAATIRNYDIRDKSAETVVRRRYLRLRIRELVRRLEELRGRR